jgi:hypothetical protein
MFRCVAVPPMVGPSEGRRSAVPNIAVFCSSLTWCFPGTLLKYFLKDFEMVPVAPLITSVTFVFTFHMRCISVVRFLYFRIFSAYYYYYYYYYYCRRHAVYGQKVISGRMSHLIHLI